MKSIFSYPSVLRYLCWLIVVLAAQKGMGQDIERIAKGDVLTANGNIGVNQLFYFNKGKLPSRKPYVYVLQGQLNLKLFGFIDAPFSCIYSNTGNKFSQPTFNQTAIHPTYKWVTLHMGAITANYSPYTMNGHLLKGASLDLSPGKWKLSFLYGRFQKAVSPDAYYINSLSTVSYRRMGKAAKIGYQFKSGTGIGVSVFHAIDDIRSLPELTEYMSVRPKQNLAGGISINSRLGKRISFSGDLGLSAFVEDNRSSLAYSNNWLAKVMDHRVSTAYFKAIKSSLVYGFGRNSIFIKYERIDPGYKTLGSYFFTNDLENLAMGFGIYLFRGKLNIQTQNGLQRDNLNGDKLSRMNRLVNSTIVSLNMKKASMGLSYSNFLSYTNLRSNYEMQTTVNPYLNWDTLNFRQISQNFSGTMSIPVFSSQKRIFMLSGSLVYQTNSDRQNGILRNGSEFYQAAGSLNLQLPQKNFSLSFSANVAQTDVNDMEFRSYSPVLSLTKSFAEKKLKAGLSVCYTMNKSQTVAPGSFLNLRSQWSYTYDKIHTFSLAALYLKRSITNTAGSASTGNSLDASVMLNYVLQLVHVKK